MKPDEFVASGKRGLPVRAFVMDCHMHLGENRDFYIPHYNDLDLVVHEMDRLGVDVGGVSSIPGCLGGLLAGTNDLVLQALKRHPTRFFGWATFNPHYPDAMREELEQCWQGGCRGIKLHNAIGMEYDHPNYRISCDFAARQGTPILAHTWGGELDKLEPLVQEYSTVNWTFGHAGAALPEKYVRMAATYPNVYVDICYSRSPRGLIEYFIEQGICEKVMFSSDCYFMGLPQQLGRVLFARISPLHKAMILGGNARRFFGKWCPQ